ncbi:Histidine protein methyltransferase 1 [Kappamyces sp. JEL0680]|nr:Histidine protein methyltransferase 1 [Kappamyces sp. JEL0680]
MSFSFQFQDDKDETPVGSKAGAGPEFPAKVVGVGEQWREGDIKVETVRVAADFGLWKRTLEDINMEVALKDDLVSQNELAHAITTQSDLIAGVYEGGLKTWECSLDLAEYLFRHPDLVRNKTVIELGCGSALPGITALKLGAKHVSFQDYNEDVLHYVTGPNVLVNTSHEPRQSEIDPATGEVEVAIGSHPDYGNSAFYSGDWRTLDALVQPQDVVLTSETIYSADSIPRLLRLIKHLLGTTGLALVAAKHTYFGCSGSLELFKIQAEAMGFRLESVFKHGSGIRREIIAVVPK